MSDLIEDEFGPLPVERMNSFMREGPKSMTDQECTRLVMEAKMLRHALKLCACSVHAEGTPKPEPLSKEEALQLLAFVEYCERAEPDAADCWAAKFVDLRGNADWFTFSGTAADARTLGAKLRARCLSGT